MLSALISILVRNLDIDEGTSHKDPLSRILDELSSLKSWKEKLERKEKGKERVEINQDEREQIREEDRRKIMKEMKREKQRAPQLAVEQNKTSTQETEKPKQSKN